jgi:two-component system, NtrC family, response regulator HupR/HoxA
MIELDKNDSVLFVDDEQQILKTLRRMFINEPYQKFFSETVEEALKIINNNEINVLVSDLTIPGDGGLKFLRIVTEQYPDIIRIVLTGQSVMPFSLKLQKDDPIFRYIVKPWSSDQDLINTIRWGIGYNKLLKFRNEILNQSSEDQPAISADTKNESIQSSESANTEVEKLQQFLLTDITSFIQYCNILLSDKLHKYIELTEFLNFKKQYNGIVQFISSLKK